MGIFNRKVVNTATNMLEGEAEFIAAYRGDDSVEGLRQLGIKCGLMASTPVLLAILREHGLYKKPAWRKLHPSTPTAK